MAKSEKDGLFKRLFGAKKNGCCCGVKIEEVDEAPKEGSGKETPPQGCCQQTPKS